jgi:quinol monooxygenase YgiN
MANETVRVIARVTAQLDKIAALRTVLAALVEPTRQEPGCLSYILAQDRQQPAEFVFIEEWASEAAIDGHMNSGHVHAAFVAAGPLLAKPPEIRRLARIA